MTDNQLHEASESKSGALGFQPGRLYSMLDIVGGGIATCDSCQRWQRFLALDQRGAQEHLARHGWTFTDGKDVCPRCSPRKAKKA